MITHFKRPMHPLSEFRTVRIYTPPEYDQNQTARFPVLYMHDGQNCFFDQDAAFGTSWRVHEVIEQVGWACIVVGIDNNTENFGRFDEYAPWVNHEISKEIDFLDRAYGGKGAAYIDWIVHELKPWVDAQFRTIINQNYMIGSSMGGLITTFAAARYPKIFQRTASVSSAYWFNQSEIESFLSDTDLSGIENMYLDIGSQEVTSSIDAQKYIQSSEKVVNILKRKQVPYRFEIIEGALHNETAWNQRLPMIFDYLRKKG